MTDLAWLCIPTFSMAILSSIAGIYMSISIYIMKRRRNIISDDKVIRIIIWLIVCNLCECIWIIVNWGPQIIVPSFDYDDTSCYIIGLWAQFWLMNDVCCHFFIGYSLLVVTLMSPVNTPDILKYDSIHMIFVYLFCTACTVAPTVTNKYGNYNNDSNINVNEQECWISDPIYAMILYIPITLVIIFHYIVLLVAFIKWRQTESSTDAYKVLFKRLFAFAVIYSIANIPCTIARVWGLFDEPPLELIVLHHMGMAGRGFGNGIAWYINVKSNSANINMDGQRRLFLPTVNSQDPPASNTGSHNIKITLSTNERNERKTSTQNYSTIKTPTSPNDYDPAEGNLDDIKHS